MNKLAYIIPVVTLLAGIIFGSFWEQYNNRSAILRCVETSNHCTLVVRGERYNRTLDAYSQEEFDTLFAPRHSE